MQQLVEEDEKKNCENEKFNQPESSKYSNAEP